MGRRVQWNAARDHACCEIHHHDFASSCRSEVGVHSTHVAWLYIWNCVVLGHTHLPSLLRLNLYTWQSTMRLVHVLSCIGNASSDHVRVVKSVIQI